MFLANIDLGFFQPMSVETIFCFTMSNKLICTCYPFFFLEYLFVIHFVHQFSYPHQNCSGSLNSVLRRCDNKVYFARQASASLGYFMRQTSIEEVLKVFLLLKYFTMFYLLINFLVNDSLLTGLLNTMIKKLQSNFL